jgi:hypothetical protein
MKMRPLILSLIAFGSAVLVAEVLAAPKAKKGREPDYRMAPLVIPYGNLLTAITKKDIKGDADPIESPEVLQRMTKLGEVFTTQMQTWKSQDTEIQAHLAARDAHVKIAVTCHQQLAEVEAEIVAAQRQIAQLNQNNSPLLSQFQQDEIRAEIAQLNKLGEVKAAAIKKSKPELDKVVALLEGLDKTIKIGWDAQQKTWQELQGSRKQLNELLRPFDQLAMGKYRDLKKLIDIWLLVDDIWDEGLLLSALCAYESGDIAETRAQLDKADALRKDVYRQPKRSAALEAAYAIVLIKTPNEGKNARDAIAAARKVLDAKQDWLTHYLIARFSFEREQEHPVAKSSLDSALKIRPDLLCAQLLQARLMVETSQKKLQDLPKGLAALKEIDRQTGQRSPWIAAYLAVASQLNGQEAAAKQFQQRVSDANLAPEDLQAINDYWDRLVAAK